MVASLLRQAKGVMSREKKVMGGGQGHGRREHVGCGLWAPASAACRYWRLLVPPPSPLPPRMK